ncbi:MAG: sugar ABC transporter permease [Clostridiales bacterium]|jgi:multiple sugar transport system permease protein|nr:sugar ABC transporter permease [Clostridiales bacterium]
MIALLGRKLQLNLKEIRKNYSCYLFMAPFALCFFAFVILPVFIAIYYSFTYFDILEAPVFIGMKNYIRLFFEDGLFLTALKNTLLIAVITGPLGYLLCLIVAWLINELPPFMRAIVTLCFYAPAIANVYFIWSIIFSGDQYGYINSILLNLDLISSPIQFLEDKAYIMPIAIFIIIWVSLGTSFLSFIAGLQGVDRTLFEAGAVDGIRNRWQELWFITLPSIRGQLLFAAVMSITGSFTVGGVITGLFGDPATTDYAAWTLAQHLEDYGGVRFDMGYACAIATVMFILMFGCNSAVQKLLRKVGT